MKHVFMMLALAFFMVTVSAGEIRQWTLNNGQTIEAEFVSLIGGKVALKTLRGKLLKIPQNGIAPEDLSYVELLNPPRLDISFSKMTRQHVYPPLTQWFEANNVPPRSLYFNFSTQIKQLSPNPYHHELIAEIFVIAVEVGGDKNILIDYRKEPFHLSGENGRAVSIAGAQDRMMTTYLAPSGRWRGEKYEGYMVVITDPRGEIIAHATTRDWWFEKLENLRRVPVGKTFDEEGKRCWPSRPKESDY
ncbi:SHD1 domain-containing protein [Pontiella sp. NLcol2]|uniref:SHD1 domain-containing protein n=2 Tax=Pontiella agarivorans TaxID=3038953 RepID=A0ABU5MU58_9BACT|nr:SHD1 domain-containing protein [Pontiella agarivorans]